MSKDKNLFTHLASSKSSNPIDHDGALHYEFLIILLRYDETTPCHVLRRTSFERGWRSGSVPGSIICTTWALNSIFNPAAAIIWSKQQCVASPFFGEITPRLATPKAPPHEHCQLEPSTGNPTPFVYPTPVHLSPTVLPGYTQPSPHRIQCGRCW